MQATHVKYWIGNKPRIFHYLFALSNALKINFAVNVQLSIYCTKPVKRDMNHPLEGVYFSLLIVIIFFPRSEIDKIQAYKPLFSLYIQVICYNHCRDTQSKMGFLTVYIDGSSALEMGPTLIGDVHFNDQVLMQQLGAERKTRILGP